MVIPIGSHVKAKGGTPPIDCKAIVVEYDKISDQYGVHVLNLVDSPVHLLGVTYYLPASEIINIME